MIKSIRNVEDRFNRKFNYDWVFLNDDDFTQEFKDLTTALVSGKTKYGKIPKEHWSYPDWIDLKRAEETRKNMKLQKSFMEIVNLIVICVDLKVGFGDIHY